MCWQRDTEWKQFSIISNEDLIKLDPSVQPQSVGLVISHSCDIANTNLQAEPTIEILIGIFNEKNVMVLFLTEKIIVPYIYK